MSLNTIIDIIVVVLGGALGGTGLAGLLFRFLPPERRPYDWGVAVPALAVIAGIGGAFWKLLPADSGLRTLAFLAGIAGIAGMSIIGLAAAGKPSTTSGTKG